MLLVEKLYREGMTFNIKLRGEKVNNYKIINANSKEEEFIDDVINYIVVKYSDKITINQLKKIEVVDELPGGSSGRAERNKMILARKNGLEILNNKKYDESKIDADDGIKSMVSTIYHELWHISTWKQYEYMYEYVLDKKNDNITAYAFMFWIEYIANIETAFMEVENIMKKFCEKFVHKKWHRIEGGYSYFIKALPYYLAYSRYLNCFDEFTRYIEFQELRSAVLDFYKVSNNLLQDKKLQDIDKALVIKDMIKKLFE